MCDYSCLCLPVCKSAWAVIHCYLWPLRLYHIFAHYLIKGTTFRQKLLNTKYVFWFSLQVLSETFLILRRTERDKIKNVYCSSCNVPVILVRLQWILNFLNTLKINKCQISRKSVQWESSRSMRTDRQADTANLIPAFRNFVTAPKNTVPQVLIGQKISIAQSNYNNENVIG